MIAVYVWLSLNGLVINSENSEAVLFSIDLSARKSATTVKQVDVAGSLLLSCSECNEVFTL